MGQEITMEKVFSLLLKLIAMYTVEVQPCAGVSFNYFVVLVSCILGRSTQRRSQWYSNDDSVLEEYQFMENMSTPAQIIIANVANTPSSASSSTMKAYDRCVDPFDVVKIDLCPKALLLTSKQISPRNRFGYLGLGSHGWQFDVERIDARDGVIKYEWGPNLQLLTPLRGTADYCYDRAVPGFRYGNHVKCIEDVVLQITGQHDRAFAEKTGQSSKAFSEKKIWFKRVVLCQAVETHFAGFRWGCSAKQASFVRLVNGGVYNQVKKSTQHHYYPTTDRSDDNFLPNTMSSPFKPQKANR